MRALHRIRWFRPLRLRASIACLALALACGTFACASEKGEASPALPATSNGCVVCHAREADALQADTSHRDAGCGACHGEHADGAGGGPVALVARCEDCHAAVSARFTLPFRHPLPKESGCTSCHPPHGLAPRESRVVLRRDACLSCHREYAGPYAFDHEGDRTLQCLSCHEPHGSPNRRLLTHSETRMLCMSCHIHLDQTHIQNAGSIYRECLNCHTEVHGSNWSRELLR